MCKDKNAKNESTDLSGFVFMNCPICGKYILSSQSRYINHRALKLDISNNLKARDFLFYHKSNSFCLIGTEEEFEDFRLSCPRTVVKWVTEQQINNWYPHSLSQIINFAVTYFNNYQSHFGQKMTFSYYQLRALYFVNADGMNSEDAIPKEYKEQIDFITNYLCEMKLMNSGGAGAYSPPCKWSQKVSLYLTPKGIEKADHLQKSQNREVFVAMSFHESADAIRKAIKRGIENANFSSLLMDEVKHNHQIVPEMLRLIKETRFMIMDITQPNFGAYYEAGYAQGLGKEVIITCSQTVWNQKDFLCDLDEKCSYKQIATKPHFDIAQKQILVWKDYDDLTKQLTEWIKLIIE